MNNILNRRSLSAIIRILAVVLLMLTTGINAQQIPDKPNPPRLVNDFAKVMNGTQTAKLENYLTQFARETSTQIVVVTVPSLDGTDVADFTFKLGEKWGVGQKGKDNGIVILVKPKTGAERGRAFIATGYGLEGAVPDAIARQIVDNEMIPYFKQNDYFNGIAAGVQVVADLTRGEYTADEYVAKTTDRPFTGVIAIIVLIAVFSIFSKSSRNSHRNNMGGRGSNLPFWLMMSMMGGSSRNHSGSFGNFSSGGGSFGGGGFGGFGGGSFGGGGAGGSW